MADARRNKHAVWNNDEIRIFAEWFPHESLDTLAEVFNLATRKSVCGMASYFRRLGHQIDYRTA